MSLENRSNKAELQHSEYEVKGAYHRKMGALIRGGIIRYDIALHLMHPTDDPVLDFGGGDGQLTSMALQQGLKAVNYDNDLLALSFGKEKDKRINAVHGASPLPFASNSFGAVFTLETLEHIADDLSAVRELYRVLKPGGQIIVSIPSDAFPVEDKHFIHYSKESVTQLLKQAGFEVDQTLGVRSMRQIFDLLSIEGKVNKAKFMGKYFFNRARGKQQENIDLMTCAENEATTIFAVAHKPNK